MLEPKHQRTSARRTGVRSNSCALKRTCSSPPTHRISHRDIFSTVRGGAASALVTVVILLRVERWITPTARALVLVVCCALMGCSFPRWTSRLHAFSNFDGELL
jgi:hypothetical protein